MSRSDGSTADYYVLPEGATQLQDLISHRNMNAQIGEIFRAGYRYGMASHSDMLRDAKKIRFYAQAEVERLEKLSAAVEEPDLNEWQEWQKGDIVESLEDSVDIKYGERYVLAGAPNEDGDIYFKDSAGDIRNRDADKYRFISRPTSTTK